LERVVWIGVFGALGAMSRYAVQAWMTELVGRPTHLGTFIVNISGAFVLGLFFAFSEERSLFSSEVRSAVTIGFLGAYTTFSTLMLEVVGRAEGGEVTSGVLYLAASLVVGLIAVYGGLTLGRAVG
jgi:CrcB protein